jgi:hypothetical protein
MVTRWRSPGHARRIARADVGEKDVAEMSARGWDPTVARRIAEDRAQSERELVQQLVVEPKYRDRLRDVVSAPATWRSSSSMSSRKPS